MHAFLHLLCGVGALGASLNCFAAVEKTAVPFRKINFDTATAAAAKEDKIVFIDFYTTWCEPCKRLDAITWTESGVGKLVGDKAVPLKIDAEKEGKDLASRYKIDAYPTLLLLKADGTELDRIVGFREPAAFTAEFTAGLAGKTALKRAREEAESAAKVSTREQVDARYKLARELMSGPARDSLRLSAIRSSVTDIEVLAGAGDLVHARELCDRVMALDSSDALKAAIKAGLIRAGVKEL